MAKVYWFGSGNMYFIPPAVSPAVPSPIKCGVLQDGSIESSFTLEEIYGQNKFPEAAFQSKGKISGKSKMADIKMNVFSLFWGGSAPATGQIIPIAAEAASIPDTPGPYTVTVINGAAFKQDLGVVYALTGIPFTRVAPGSEAAGAYSLNTTTGVYTFAVADKKLGVLIDYLYTSALVGLTLAIANQMAGLTPTFMLVLNNLTGVYGAVMILNNCISSKLGFTTAVGKATFPEFDFSATVDPGENVGLISLPY